MGPCPTGWCSPAAPRHAPPPSRRTHFNAACESWPGLPVPAAGLLHPPTPADDRPPERYVEVCQLACSTGIYVALTQTLEAAAPPSTSLTRSSTWTAWQPVGHPQASTSPHQSGPFVCLHGALPVSLQSLLSGGGQVLLQPSAYHERDGRSVHPQAQHDISAAPPRSCRLRVPPDRDPHRLHRRGLLAPAPPRTAARVISRPPAAPAVQRRPPSSPPAPRYVRREEWFMVAGGVALPHREGGHAGGPWRRRMTTESRGYHRHASGR